MGAFIKALGEQAAGAASSIVGTGLGMATAAWNDRRQLRQQAKLQNQEMAGQIAMTNYNQQKQMEMWKATGPTGQMQQLQEAGLNPGLIYGMGGAGGQTAQVTPGAVKGGEAPRGGNEIGLGIQQGAQLALLQAQKENIEADTANKRGEAANKPLEGKNIEAGTEWTNTRNSLDKVRVQIADVSMNDAIDIIRNERNQAESKARSMLVARKIDEATMQTEMDKINLEYATMGVEKKLKEVGITQKEGEISALVQRVINETKATDNKITDDAYYRTIHDVSDSLDLTVKSAADVLRIILALVGVKSAKTVISKRIP